MSSYASLLQKDEAKNLQDWLKQNYNLNRFEKAARKLVETNSVDHDFERRWHELVIWAITLSEFLTILTPDEVEEFSTVLLVVYFEMVDSGVEIPEYLVNSMIHVQCRICAVNADMAESTMPFFAHQLEFNKNPKTRATALSALADLCTVKTQLVDQFLDVIAATLDDRSLYVRCVALKQLTNLLKKDFIKLRPSILSRMLIQAADKDPKIRKVAEKASYCLTYVLAPRQPTLFYSHFTEIMMLATGAHQIDGHKESRLLSTQTQASVVKSQGQFPGSKKREKRLDIYSFCIENMTDERRIYLLAKLAEEVLQAPVHHSQIDTSDSAVAEILSDAIKLLHHHPLLQFSIKSGRGENQEDDEDFDGESANAQKRKVTKEKLAGIRFLVIRDTVFPVLYDLHEIAKRQKSACVPDLLRLMIDWLKDVPELIEKDRKYISLSDQLESDLVIFEDMNPNQPEPPSRASCAPSSVPDLESVPQEALSRTLTNLNVSMATPNRKKRRETFGGKSIDQIYADQRRERRKSLDIRKPRPISTPFHRNDKENRISLGSGISEIPGRINQTDNTDTDSWADLTLASARSNRKSK